jgi:tetratricopeptide (TPR) repeat protein
MIDDISGPENWRLIMNPLLPLVIILLPLFIVFLVVLREMRFRKAFTLVRKGNFAQALKIFQEFSTHKGHLISSLWGMAQGYQGLEQFDSALKSLKNIPLTQTGNNQFFTPYEYYSKLSDILCSLKKYEESIKYLLVIKEKFGDTAFVNQRIGECFYQLKDTRRAFHYLNLAMEKGGGADTMSLLGIIYYRLGNFDECLKIFKKALKIDPSHKTARVYLGFTFFRLKRYSHAVSFLQRVVPDEADEITYTWIIGSAAFHAKDFSSAYSSLQKFLTMVSLSSPDYPDALFQLAHSAEQIGKFDEAAGLWEKLMLTDPVYPGASQRYKLSRHYLSSRTIKNFLFSPREIFTGLSEAILEKLHYTIKLVTEQTDWSAGYVVSSDDVSLPFGKKFVLFIRSTNPEWTVDENMFEKCLSVMKKESTDNIEIYTIGPIAENARDFARTHKISIKDLDDVAALLAQGD